MKLKNIILGGLIIVLSISSASAQLNILNSATPQDIGLKTLDQLAYDNDMPLPYGFIDERDILWSKATWEIIDLDERVNFPLYYPIETEAIGSDRRSLYDVLISNIKNGNIKDIYTDSYFIDKTSLTELESSLVYVDDEQYKLSLEDGIDNPSLIDKYYLEAANIEQWKIRGLWYIDKRLGELRYRIIAICPVAEEARAQATGEKGGLVDLFWVYFPAAREVLHQAKAFNKKNTSRPISYDHLLNSRRFSSVIYKEENVYGDREVKEYISENAFMQLLESDRIKEQIRNIEIDLWNY
jgi:gliding motility associated protien GldN